MKHLTTQVRLPSTRRRSNLGFARLVLHFSLYRKTYVNQLKDGGILLAALKLKQEIFFFGTKRGIALLKSEARDSLRQKGMDLFSLEFGSKVTLFGLHFGRYSTSPRYVVPVAITNFDSTHLAAVLVSKVAVDGGHDLWGSVAHILPQEML
ncbi:hypothetical protein K1719_032670 [Acacia pycnantha]|nr:hypothetical protein K1719_032670 [Acacia pycnantha]